MLFKSWAVEIVPDAGGVINSGGKENGGRGGKNGYIYLSSCDFLDQLVRYVNSDSYPAFCSSMNTKIAQPSSCKTTSHLKNEKPQDEI